MCQYVRNPTHLYLVVRTLIVLLVYLYTNTRIVHPGDMMCNFLLDLLNRSILLLVASPFGSLLNTGLSRLYACTTRFRTSH